MDSTNKSSNVTIQVFTNGVNESIIDLSLTDDSGMVTEMINSYGSYDRAHEVADMLSESTDDLYSVAESEGFIYVNESSSDKKFKGLTSVKYNGTKTPSGYTIPASYNNDWYRVSIDPSNSSKYKYDIVIDIDNFAESPSGGAEFVYSTNDESTAIKLAESLVKQITDKWISPANMFVRLYKDKRFKMTFPTSLYDKLKSLIRSNNYDESITINLSSNKKYDDNQYANNDSVAETSTTKHTKYSVSPELDSDGLVRLRFINAINDYDMLCKSFSNCRVDQDNDDVLLYMI